MSGISALLGVLVGEPADGQEIDRQALECLGLCAEESVSSLLVGTRAETAARGLHQSGHDVDAKMLKLAASVILQRVTVEPEKRAEVRTAPGSHAREH
jgi:hypothetical protein